MHLERINPFDSVRNGKGNKLCNIPLMAKTVDHLKHYIAEFHSGRIILSKHVDMARVLCPDILKKSVAIRSEKPGPWIYTGMVFRFIHNVLLGHKSEATTKSFYAFAAVDINMML